MAEGAAAGTPATTAPLADPGPIVAMSVWHARIPVRTPRGHGIGTVAHASEHVFLKLTSESGLVGWGEASPWAVFTGTAEAAAAALDRYLRPLVMGRDPRRVAAIMTEANRTLVGHAEAKAALETALLDIVGRAAGLSVADLLGGRCRDTIPLSFSVANPDFGADRELIADLYGQGIRLFKLKTGFSGHDFDCQRLEALRRDFPEADVRVDYNQGLAPHEALRRLRDVETFAPTFIEQPVPRAARQAMIAITAALDTPILADESVFLPQEAIAAIRDGVCDLISVKIMKSGGLRAGQTIAAIAEAEGVACYGGDMFESGVAHLAGTHMIAATANISLGCEFYQALWYLESDVLSARFPVVDGQVVVPTTPGLGIDVDETQVDAHAVSRCDGGRS